MIRVVIDGRMILPYMTGVGRYLLGLVSGLLDQASDIDLLLWLQHNLPAEHPARTLFHDRLHLKLLPFRQMSLAGYCQLPLEISHLRPDVLHYPHFDLPRFTPGQIVATIHDLKYIARPEFFPRMSRVRFWIIRTMTSYTCRRARFVITDSESTTRDLFHYLRVPLSKIRTIPLGVDPCFFQPRSIQSLRILRNQYHLSDPFLLFVGERRPHKNIIGLIEAFDIFRKMTSKPYRLVIAGRPYADDLTPEKLVEKLNLQDRVLMIDSLPDRDLPLLYQAADAFVFLSHYEGFGLPVIEAMASGIPVVASNTTSIKEVAGNAARLVPPDHPGQVAVSIGQVVTGGEYRDGCIQLGLQQARKFTWSACAAQTLEVYREVTNS